MDRIECAAMGGRARAARLTPQERSDSARKAAQARWAKNRSPVSAPVVSISASAGIPPKAEMLHVTLVRVFNRSVLFSAGAETYAPHTRTFCLSTINP